MFGAGAETALFSSKIDRIEPTTIYAHGKLLLTAEYFVLDGALALALPTRAGQTFHFKPTEGAPGQIRWRSFDHTGNLWFESVFDPPAGAVHQATDGAVAQRLTQIFQAIAQLSGAWPVAGHALQIEARLDFPRHWGLGSSSTLIAAMAQWAGVDAFRLLEATFGGSGYDLACAFADGPILYQRRDHTGHWATVLFSPPFQEQLYFVGLGAKQNSREGIARYRSLNPPPGQELLHQISQLTQAFLQADTLDEFERLLRLHEDVVSATLELPAIGPSLFPDYPGAIKSLGAWGGDFALATSRADAEATLQYFAERGYAEVVPYAGMVIGDW